MSNYAIRRDVRTDEEFEVQIKHRTKRETICFQPWCEQHNIEYEDTGDDNSGGVNRGKVKKTPDFFVPAKKLWIDAKVSPSDMATFKAFDLTHYQNFKGAVYPKTGETVTDIMWMVFINTGMRGTSLSPSPKTEYFWFKQEDVDWFMQHAQYNAADKYFGFKPTCRMYRDQLNEHFQIYRLFK